MDDQQKERIFRYMTLSKQKLAVIRMKERYFVCQIVTQETAWERQEYDEVRITECAQPVELV